MRGGSKKNNSISNLNIEINLSCVFAVLTFTNLRLIQNVSFANMEPMTQMTNVQVLMHT